MGKKIMELNTGDKNYLARLGYKPSDFRQIENAINDVDLSITDNDIIIGCKTRKCGVKMALEVLDREDFISGISRAAFHASATRKSSDGRFEIHFDLSKWWR